MASAYGTGNLNPTNVNAEKKLLDVIGAWLASEPHVETKRIPKNKNETQLFSRAVIPDANTTPATEGVTPAARSLTMEQVQETLEEFVEIYGFTSRQTELGEFDVVGAAKDVMAELVGITREEYAWSKWIAGDNVYYNSNSVSARNGVNGAVTVGRLDKVIRLLNNNRANYHTKAAQGALQQGTVPMPPQYIAFGHTDLLSDLRALAGWREAPEVGGLKIANMHWVGSVRNIAFVLSPHFRSVPDAGAAIGSAGMKSTTGANNDVYPIVVFGAKALGRGSLAGSESKGGYGGVKINVLDGADKSDPGNQRTYVSCRWWDMPIILVEPHAVRLEVAVTDNP